MDATNLTNIIINSGFSGAVLVWFLLRMEKILQSNTKAVNNNSMAILTLVLQASHGEKSPMIDKVEEIKKDIEKEMEKHEN